MFIPPEYFSSSSNRRPTRIFFAFRIGYWYEISSRLPSFDFSASDGSASRRINHRWNEKLNFPTKNNLSRGVNLGPSSVSSFLFTRWNSLLNVDNPIFLAAWMRSSCKTSLLAVERASKQASPPLLVFESELNLCLSLETNECSSSGDFYRLGNESIIIFASVSRSLQFLIFLVDVLRCIRRRRLRNKRIDFQFSDFAIRALQDKLRQIMEGRRYRERDEFLR